MRAAVVFRHLHELSVAETADVLYCSQGTVKSQTSRAWSTSAAHSVSRWTTTPRQLPSPRPAVTSWSAP
jgi:hypothetical protein